MSMNFKDEMHKKHFINKLENPARIAELAPAETLERIGLKPGDVFCDIGAGTGIFTFPAADITRSIVYAVDTSKDMQEYLASKEISGVKVESSINNIPADSCDVVLLCCMLHEVDDIPEMSRELCRILKQNGTLAIIEFHKRDTVMGPPMNHRLSEEEAARSLGNSFISACRFDLGENFYCLSFGKEA